MTDRSILVTTAGLIEKCDTHGNGSLLMSSGNRSQPTYCAVVATGKCIYEYTGCVNQSGHNRVVQDFYLFVQ